MYIIIAGGGMVGGSLARKLVDNRHDVVVIEQDKKVCMTLASRIGALTVNGSGTDIELLEEAGIRKADVAVGALPGDGENLAFALLARNFKVPNIIARMRDPRYDQAYRMAGVTRTLNVADLFVNQLVLEIEQPSLRQVATFGRGKQAAIVVVAIPEEATVDGMTVQQIAGDALFPDDCIMAGIFRPGTEEFVIPRGPAEVHSGDQVFLAANSASVRKAAKFLQRKR